MVRYHAKSLFRDLYVALRRRGSWSEVRYHVLSLWSDLIHPARCVLYGCRNLYAYVPLIWHDRDWDHVYLLVLWEKKFARMASEHEFRGHCVESPQKAAQLREAAALCHRVRMDEYADPPLEAHDKKWGKSHHVFLPTGHGTQVWRVARLNVRNDRDKENERREFMRIITAGERQKAADVTRLALLIRKHLLKWWD